MTETEMTKHELRDADPRPIVFLALSLVVLSGFIFLGLWLLFQHFASREAKLSGPSRLESQAAPPEPRLQTTPEEDLKAFRKSEDVLLESYAWIDPKKGAVRIPVKRAMELLAEKGLPARKQDKKE